LGLLELLLRLGSSGFEVLSDGVDLSEEELVVLNGLFLILLVLIEGLNERVSDGLELLDDEEESVLVEGGGDLDEGGDGVVSSDLSEFNQSLLFVSGGLDGLESGDDEVEGSDDLTGLSLSLGEGSGVFLSLLSELLILLGEDLDLSSLVGDVNLEGVDSVVELVDGESGLVDLVGGVVDSAVEVINGLLALSLLSSISGVSLSLLVLDVNSDVVEELRDVSDGGLVLELEGDGVQNLLSELVLLELH
jgi:hypothetical protein